MKWTPSAPKNAIFVVHDALFDYILQSIFTQLIERHKGVLKETSFRFFEDYIWRFTTQELIYVQAPPPDTQINFSRYYKATSLEIQKKMESSTKEHINFMKIQEMIQKFNVTLPKRKYDEFAKDWFYEFEIPPRTFQHKIEIELDTLNEIKSTPGKSHWKVRMVLKSIKFKYWKENRVLEAMIRYKVKIYNGSLIILTIREDYNDKKEFNLFDELNEQIARNRLPNLFNPLDWTSKNQKISRDFYEWVWIYQKKQSSGGNGTRQNEVVLNDGILNLNYYQMYGEIIELRTKGKTDVETLKKIYVDIIPTLWGYIYLPQWHPLNLSHVHFSLHTGHVAMENEQLIQPISREPIPKSLNIINSNTSKRDYTSKNDGVWYRDPLVFNKTTKMSDSTLINPNILRDPKDFKNDHKFRLFSFPRSHFDPISTLDFHNRDWLTKDQLLLDFVLFGNFSIYTFKDEIIRTPQGDRLRVESIYQTMWDTYMNQIVLKIPLSGEYIGGDDNFRKICMNVPERSIHSILKQIREKSPEIRKKIDQLIIEDEILVDHQNKRISKTGKTIPGSTPLKLEMVWDEIMKIFDNATQLDGITFVQHIILKYFSRASTERWGNKTITSLLDDGFIEETFRNGTYLVEWKDAGRDHTDLISYDSLKNSEPNWGGANRQTAPEIDPTRKEIDTHIFYRFVVPESLDGTFEREDVFLPLIGVLDSEINPPYLNQQHTSKDDAKKRFAMLEYDGIEKHSQFLCWIVQYGNEWKYISIPEHIKSKTTDSIRLCLQIESMTTPSQQSNRILYSENLCIFPPHINRKNIENDALPFTFAKLLKIPFSDKVCTISLVQRRQCYYGDSQKLQFDLIKVWDIFTMCHIVSKDNRIPVDLSKYFQTKYKAVPKSIFIKPSESSIVSTKNVLELKKGLNSTYTDDLKGEMIILCILGTEVTYIKFCIAIRWIDQRTLKQIHDETFETNRFGDIRWKFDGNWWIGSKNLNSSHPHGFCLFVDSNLKDPRGFNNADFSSRDYNETPEWKRIDRWKNFVYQKYLENGDYLEENKERSEDLYDKIQKKFKKLTTLTTSIDWNVPNNTMQTLLQSIVGVLKTLICLQIDFDVLNGFFTNDMSNSALRKKIVCIFPLKSTKTLDFLTTDFSKEIILNLQNSMSVTI